MSKYLLRLNCSSDCLTPHHGTVYLERKRYDCYALSGPEFYARANQLQRQDCQRTLDEYIHLIRWNPRGADSVMDIGCGLGDITTEILLPKLPESLHELVATDVSPQTIQYARCHHQHPRVSYDVLDIATKTLPPAYHGRFDHLFSNYCLHWVKDQRQAVRNIFNMLRPGGDILLLYLANHPVIDIVYQVSIKDHWKPYIKDPSVYIPVYQHTPNGEELLRGLLQEVGFNSIMCQGRQNTFTYDNINVYFEHLLGCHSAFQTFTEDFQAKFVKECVQELGCQTSIDDAVTTSNQFGTPYSSIIINATKPAA